MKHFFFAALLGSTAMVPAAFAQGQAQPAQVQQPGQAQIGQRQAVQPGQGQAGQAGQAQTGQRQAVQPGQGQAAGGNAVVCERLYGFVEAYGARQPALPITLDDARALRDRPDPERCVALIQEIQPVVVGTEFERQVQEILVLVEAEPQVRAQAEVATGAQILVDQPEPTVTVQQDAPEVAVTQAPPQVTVRQPEPEVIVRQAQPVVRVVMPQPTITIEQPEPEIIVRMPEPEVMVQQAQPQVAVQQDQPEVQVQQGHPQVQVQQSQPQVSVDQAGQAQVRVQQAQPVVQLGQAQRAEVQVEQAQPRVSFERAEPRVEVQQAGEAQVQFNQVGEPNVRFEQMEGAAVQGQVGQQAQQAPLARAAQQRDQAVVAEGQARTEAVVVAPADRAATGAAVTGANPYERLRARVETPLRAERRAITADELDDMDVVGMGGEEIGDIERVVTNGNRTFVILGHGGFLGLGEEEVAIPLDRLAFRGDELVAIGLTEADVEALPNYNFATERRLGAADPVEVGTID
jgi:hypothetical protein